MLNIAGRSNMIRTEGVLSASGIGSKVVFIEEQTPN